MNRVLVLAPHGDDEVIGCGGTIIKHLESSSIVTVVFIKAPYDERSYIQHTQTEDCKKILGYHDKISLYLTETDFFKKEQFITKLEEIILTTRPDTIYSTFYGDLHQDHRALFDALNSASRIHAKHRVDNIFLYETASSTDQGLYKNIFPFIPNYYVPLKKHHIDKKINALKAYTKEIKDNNHPRSEEHIMDIAKIRGREINEPYAEAFMSLRIIGL